MTVKTSLRKVAGKKLRAVRKALDSAPTPAEHTLSEILSQPATWRETARQLEQQGMLELVSKVFFPGSPWLFLACGSSYYLSQLVATLWTRQLQVPCSAVPASEFLFAPDETLRRTGAQQVVLVSRSGETTEVLRAAKLLAADRSILTLGVTCNAESPLEKLCARTLKLTWANEKSTVMTRSFTSMLIAFERLGAKFAGDLELVSALDRLPEQVQPWLAANAGKIQDFGEKRRFADFIFLGQGAHYWMAQEAGLKITEMSSSYAQVYHTLEFRHGPRSIASRNTLITFLLSEAAAEEETLLVSEMKELGAATFVVTNRATEALERASDLLIELRMDEPEFARLAPTAIPAQLLGAAVGLRKGLNPDAPKNLSRVVTLDPNGSGAVKRRGA
ncbi:MAG TPA: SIS domain-containing protein [Candidatus Acidoferrum sp.]|nr:SIS domain-containing protein [Candidatus Acidoferrum sp.]